MAVSGHTQVIEGTQVIDTPLVLQSSLRNMSKVLGEKIGIEQLDWARFDPNTWVSEEVGYDFDPTTWARKVVGSDTWSRR